jgi:hypothetical protein
MIQAKDELWWLLNRIELRNTLDLANDPNRVNRSD